MATIIKMPKQGNTVETCILTKWYKQVGDPVAAGDLLFAYETDKSAFEEAAEVTGVMLRLLCEEGDEIPVMQPICAIGEAGEDVSALLAELPTTPEALASPTTAEKPMESPVSVTMPLLEPEKGPKAPSPRARRLAQSMGLDGAQAVGTGPNGRIIERDIYALADGVVRTAPALGAMDYTDVPMSNIRRRIAESMHQSLSSMAQLTHHSSADASAMLTQRAQFKSRGENITLNDMVLYAVSRVLKNHPDLNAHLLDNKIRRFHGVHLGVAVDTDRGLMVPTLFHADRLSLAEIAREAKALAEQCRAGAISPDKLSGGTFTVSNLGALGVELFTPVINPPQTAILGVCAILDRPRRDPNGFLQIYPALGLSLTYDHRAVDGAPASRFLKELCEAIGQMDKLLEGGEGTDAKL